MVMESLKDALMQTQLWVKAWEYITLASTVLGVGFGWRRIFAYGIRRAIRSVLTMIGAIAVFCGILLLVAYHVLM